MPEALKIEFSCNPNPTQAKHGETLRRKKELICQKISEDDLLFLCKMYYEDYIAFDLTLPNECRSLFASKEDVSIARVEGKQLHC